MPMLEVKLALIDCRVRFQPDLVPPSSSSSSSSGMSIVGVEGNGGNKGANSLRELVQGVIGA